MQYHDPVLLSESVQGLEIKPEGIYVDVTFGGGGHSREILKKLTTGKLFAFDKDRDAMNNVPNNENFQLITSDFRNILEELSAQSISEVDGLLADLGISSHQIDVPERGFSTRYEADLDMRMDATQGRTAADLVNEESEEQLAKILWQYGELRQSRSIAKSIVEARQKKPIQTTEDLKAVLARFAKRGKPSRTGTRSGREQKFYAQVFQAFRIEINDELNTLRVLLEASATVLKKGGRLSVISYHSLEDRLVKSFIAKGKFEGELEKDFYGNPQRIFKAINRKPIEASPEEVASNGRARSAKLRIAEKI